MNKIQRWFRHITVLLSSLSNAAERSRLLQLRQYLKTIIAAYDRGGLPALTGAMEANSWPPPETESPDRLLEQVEALVAVTLGSRFRTCLRRSVLFYYVLRSTGQRPILVIGVRRAAQPSGLDGHAWVELDNQPFREEMRIAEFTAMYRYPIETAKNV